MRYVFALLLVAGLLVGCGDQQTAPTTTSPEMVGAASTPISEPTVRPTGTPPPPEPTATPTPQATPTPTPTPTPTVTPTPTPEPPAVRTQIVFTSNRDGDWDIYVMDADGGNVRQLTDHPASDGSPDWSPDGSRIAFDSTRDGDWDIYVMDADGGNVRQLTDDPAFSRSDGYPAWSPVR